MIRQSKVIIIGTSTEPIAAWVHLRTARAERGRIDEKEKTFDDHENENLNLTVVVGMKKINDGL